jgi:hypothetical protein
VPGLQAQNLEFKPQFHQNKQRKKNTQCFSVFLRISFELGILKPIILLHRKLRQEYQKFEASLGCTARPFLKTNKTKHQIRQQQQKTTLHIFNFL